VTLTVSTSPIGQTNSLEYAVETEINPIENTSGIKNLNQQSGCPYFEFKESLFG
jgi:hypothetical protein